MTFEFKQIDAALKAFRRAWSGTGRSWPAWKGPCRPSPQRSPERRGWATGEAKKPCPPFLLSRPRNECLRCPISVMGTSSMPSRRPLYPAIALLFAILFAGAVVVGVVIKQEPRLYRTLPRSMTTRRGKRHPG